MITVRTISGERVDTSLYVRLVRICWFGIDNLENASFKVIEAITLYCEGMCNQTLSANKRCRP